jgi:hypothetical protein
MYVVVAFGAVSLAVAGVLLVLLLWGRRDAPNYWET